MKQSPYWSVAKQELSRTLSWQDRESLSRTYGCFDRTFWSWKFTDFAGARFQEGVYPLAFLFSHALDENILYEKVKVLTWLRAGMRFWRSLQYSDGSFDEAYPFEHSLAATAFTSFYVGEAFLHVNDSIPAGEQSELRETFARAGDWLCKNDEKHGVLSNHLAAAAAALHVVFRITGDERFERRCHYFINRIYDRQSLEGWYEEYGGADPGYQTHGTFYLARLWQNTGDATLLESLRRSVGFLKHFIHPNGTLGGEYGSRNTEFYFPAGFEMLSAAIPDAAMIAQFMRPSVADQRVAGLSAMDAYNFLPLLNNYLFAASQRSDVREAREGLPCQQTGEWLFPDAGLLVKSTPEYYAVVGISKGGVVRSYGGPAGQLAHSDCGYWGELSDGGIVSSQSLGRNTSWHREEDDICIEADFVRVNQPVRSPWLFIGFRLFSLTIGRMQSAAGWLKRWLVHLLVKRRRPVTLRLSRRIRFSSDGIHVSDRIEVAGKLQVRTLWQGSKFSTIHMGSSRYFQPQDLEMTDSSDPPRNLAHDLAQERALDVARSWIGAPVNEVVHL